MLIQLPMAVCLHLSVGGSFHVDIVVVDTVQDFVHLLRLYGVSGCGLTQGHTTHNVHVRVCRESWLAIKDLQPTTPVLNAGHPDVLLQSIILLALYPGRCGVEKTAWYRLFANVHKSRKENAQ